MNLAEKIKKARADSKLTQDQLATKLNVSRKTLSGWENNRSTPNISILEKIAKVTNKNILFFTENENYIKNNKLKNILNYFNIMILTINIISLLTKYHIPGISLIEFLVLIILLNFNLKHKTNWFIKYKLITILFIFIIIFIFSIHQSISILGDFYMGGLIGSILRSIVISTSLYLAIVYIKNKEQR